MEMVQQVVNANTLTLREVRDRLQLQLEFEDYFHDFLTLDPLAEEERDRLAEIREGWQNYYADGKISEGLVGVLAITPILWASGFVSDPAMRISVEANVETIEIDDDDRVIRGRMDMVVHQREEDDQASFCVLVVESKNSAVNTSVGLPQLLTYAGTFLNHQAFVWGLVTNGREFQFVRVEPGRYREFPLLNLLRPGQSETIPEVMIAIRKAAHAIAHYSE